MSVIEFVRRVVENRYVRIALSVLIVFSLLPFGQVHQWDGYFFVIFSIEFLLRLTVFLADYKKGLSLKELILLLLDLSAVISFGIVIEAAHPMRLGRVARLIRLLYLSRLVDQVVKDFMNIARRRWYESKLIVFTIMVATLISAIVISAFNPRYNFDEDQPSHHSVYKNSDKEINKGIKENAHKQSNSKPDTIVFTKVLWWSFRQMEDTGNLVKTPHTDALIFLLSLFLTITGVIVMSFIIGIGNYLISEIIEHRRNRDVDAKRHLVAIIPDIRNFLMIERLVAIFEKNRENSLWEQFVFFFKRQKFVLVSTKTAFPTMLYNRRFSNVDYRGGNTADTGLLTRAKVAAAKRIVIASDDLRGESADAHTLSTLLAIRSVREQEKRSSEREEEQKIYAEILYSQNTVAAAYAGGGTAYCGNPKRAKEGAAPECRCVEPITREAALLCSEQTTESCDQCEYREPDGIFCRYMHGFYRTCIPVEQGTFMGLIASSTVLFPGIEVIFDELFTEKGSEIYYEDCLIDDATAVLSAVNELNRMLYVSHRSILIGAVLDDGTVLMNLKEFYRQHTRCDTTRRIKKLILISDKERNAKNSIRSVTEYIRNMHKPSDEKKHDGNQLHRFENLQLDNHFSEIATVIMVGCRYFVPTMIVELVNNSPQKRFEFQILATEESSVKRATSIITKEFSAKNFGCVLRPEKNAETGNVRRWWQLKKFSWDAAGKEVVISINTFENNTDMGNYIEEQRFDRLLLFANPLSSDPDALTILFLMNLVPTLRKREMHIVAEVISEEKGKVLFDSFFKNMKNMRGSVHLLSTEKLRSNVMVQTTYFGEDFLRIYEELLAARGMDLCKLKVPKDVISEQVIGFQDILSFATTVKAKEGVSTDGYVHIVPIGVELHTENGERIVNINPSSDEKFSIRELAYVYAIGEVDDIIFE